MGPIGVDPMKRIGWSSGACGMSSAIETIETKRGVMAPVLAVTMTDMVQVAPQVSCFWYSGVFVMSSWLRYKNNRN